MKLLKAVLTELIGNVWTYVGTGLVLITVSGRTLELGWYITIAGFVTHIVGVIVEYFINDD
tara:strand:+ start:765 stop:947 length:183 start_codon:yes stop_codon:yes gene_type:complete